MTASSRMLRLLISLGAAGLLAGAGYAAWEYAAQIREAGTEAPLVPGKSAQGEAKKEPMMGVRSSVEGLHLFGRAAVKPANKIELKTALVVPEKPLKKTRLKLILKGLVYTQNTEMGMRAIIVGPDKSEGIYGVGSPLPGGAAIKEIHATHVVLLHGGLPEVLEIQEESGDSPPPHRGISAPKLPIFPRPKN